MSPATVKKLLTILEGATRPIKGEHPAYDIIKGLTPALDVNPQFAELVKAMRGRAIDTTLSGFSCRINQDISTTSFLAHISACEAAFDLYSLHDGLALLALILRDQPTPGRAGFGVLATHTHNYLLCTDCHGQVWDICIYRKPHAKEWTIAASRSTSKDELHKETRVLLPRRLALQMPNL